MSDTLDDSWPQLQEGLSQKLKTSLTSTRITVLKELHRLLQEDRIPTTDVPALALQLLNTYDFYLDVVSSTHLVDVLNVLLMIKLEFFVNFVNFTYSCA